MTEDEAQAWLAQMPFASPERIEKLSTLRRMVLAENAVQNLISADTEGSIWTRHIVDSAQLLLLRASDDRAWLDLGTGAGFPGLVIAILRDEPITLVESRRRRTDFLQRVVDRLSLFNVTVKGCRLEAMPDERFGTVSARAFAPLPRLIEKASRFATKETIWLLPKGKSAHDELELAKKAWHGVFHVKQSITDPDAGIIVATEIRAVRAR